VAGHSESLAACRAAAGVVPGRSAHPAASTAAQAAVAACTVLRCCSPHRSVHEGLPLLTAPSPRRRVHLRLVPLPQSSPCQLWHCGHAGRVSRGWARLSIEPVRVSPLPRRPHLTKHGRAEPTYPPSLSLPPWPPDSRHQFGKVESLWLNSSRLRLRSQVPQLRDPTPP
jgi:hypothetical protein